MALALQLLRLTLGAAPGVEGIKVAAAGGDITFSLLSYNNSDIVE
jgi:hypothetical protein